MNETVWKRTVAQLIARGDMLPGETFVTHGNSIVLAMSEAGILDAHIYGSGTDIYWSGTDSISVVTTEVREKAAIASYEETRAAREARSTRAVLFDNQPLLPPWDELDEPSKHAFRRHTDAVLEVVLGQVRVAKEVTSPVLDGVLGYTTTLGLEATRILERGDTIAILED